MLNFLGDGAVPGTPGDSGDPRRYADLGPTDQGQTPPPVIIPGPGIDPMYIYIGLGLLALILITR